MQAQAVLAEMLRLSGTVVSSYTGDLTDAELLQRPAPGCNHPAWQLGHLIASEVGMINMLRPGTAPELPAGFAEKHSPENSGSDNPADFCSKQEYVELTERVHQASQELFASLSTADLDQPSPPSMQPMFPTVGTVCLLIASHPLMHAGQFVPLRRALGKPVVI